VVEAAVRGRVEGLASKSVVRVWRLGRVEFAAFVVAKGWVMRDERFFIGVDRKQAMAVADVLKQRLGLAVASAKTFPDLRCLWTVGPLDHPLSRGYCSYSSIP